MENFSLLPFLDDQKLTNLHELLIYLCELTCVIEIIIKNSNHK